MTIHKRKKDLSIKRSTRARLAAAVQRSGARTYGDFLSQAIHEGVTPQRTPDPFVRIMVNPDTIDKLRKMTRGKGITYDDVVNAAIDNAESTWAVP